MARFSFPLEQFPMYRPHGDAGSAVRRGEEQQFNSVQYGRLSAMLGGGEGGLTFRQQGKYTQCSCIDIITWLQCLLFTSGRDKHVSYQTPCLPLTPPNTRMWNVYLYVLHVVNHLFHYYHLDNGYVACRSIWDRDQNGIKWSRWIHDN